MNYDYGNFTVGGKEFYFKHDAIQEALKVDKAVHFRFQDEAFDAADCTKMPVASLRDLYKIRAEMIRAKYDYLILCYSGGADSGNVLDVFEREGIRLDEIVSFVVPDDEKYGRRTNEEITRLACPRVLRFQAKQPWCVYNKVDVIEASRKTIEGGDVDELFRTWHASGTTFCSSARMGSFIYNDQRYRDLIQAGKKVCIVWGIDKTTINYDGRRYYFTFFDWPAHIMRKHRFMPDLPVYDEMFYWTGDLPQLAIKQAHVIKQCLDLLPEDYVDPFPVSPHNPRPTFVRTRKGRMVSLNVVNSWLYDWEPKTFTLGKAGGTFLFSSLDLWLTRDLNADFVVAWRKHFQEAQRIYEQIGPQHRSHSNPKWGEKVPVLLTKRHYIDL